MKHPNGDVKSDIGYMSLEPWHVLSQGYNLRINSLQTVLKQRDCIRPPRERGIRYSCIKWMEISLCSDLSLCSDQFCILPFSSL